MLLLQVHNSDAVWREIQHVFCLLGCQLYFEGWRGKYFLWYQCFKLAYECMLTLGSKRGSGISKAMQLVGGNHERKKGGPNQVGLKLTSSSSALHNIPLGTMTSLILSFLPTQEPWRRWRRARSTWRRAKWTRRKWRASTSVATSSRAPRWPRSSTSTTSACATSRRRCSTTCSSRSPSSRKSPASWRRPYRNTTTPKEPNSKNRKETIRNVSI